MTVPDYTKKIQFGILGVLYGILLAVSFHNNFRDFLQLVSRLHYDSLGVQGWLWDRSRDLVVTYCFVLH